MTCEALVIGSLVGLVLTGTALFLQVLTDKKNDNQDQINFVIVILKIF